ncbi:MAG: hypothetical protein HYT80_02110 [Euryarchaeota archaeon]|nr:hypothetical protein [Euryarchaeota archaeon]
MARVTTFGLALVLASVALPAGAQGPPEPWSLTDAPDDVVVEAGPGQTPPVARAWFTPYVDVTSLVVEDPDEESLVFKLRTSAGFAPAAAVSHRPVFPVEHEIQFSAPGGNAALSILVESMGRQDQTPLDPLYVVRAKLCGGTRPTTGLGVGAETICNWRSRVDYRVEDGALVILLPKLELTNRAAEKDQVTQLLPPALEPGMSLQGIRVRASANVEAVAGGTLVGARFVDRAPNAGAAPPYVLRRGSTVADLSIHFDRRGVIAGEENVLLVRVDNTAPHKRLVAFSAEVETTVGDGTWTAEITPKATIPAGKTANLTLRLRTPTSGLSGMSAGEIRVVGRILTEGGLVAATSWSFTASPPLGDSHNRYFVHGFGVQQAGPQGIPLPGGLFGYASAALSRHESWPGAKDDEALPLQQPALSGNFMAGLYAAGADHIPNAARFRAGEPITGTLVLDAPTSFDGSLRILLFYRANQPFADKASPVSIREGRHAYTFSLPPLPDAAGLTPSDDRVGLFLQVSKSGLGADHVTVLNRLDPLALVPRGSFFDLPLVRAVPRSASGDLPAVFLGPTEDLEAFINPGRRQVIEFDVRNEDPQSQIVTLSAENVTNDWTVTVAPGTEFALGSNESVRVGFLVDAPADAKEGEELVFLATARSSSDRRILSNYAVRLVATRGVDIENETFEADEDAANKLATNRSTPGVGAVAILCVVSGAFTLCRRRA